MSDALHSLYWSIRRELWESRWLYLAPLAAAVVFLGGFVVNAMQLPGKVRAFGALDAMQQRHMIADPYDMAAGFLMIVAMIVGGFYCVGALQSERQDRSILFWKSLPVSDGMAVFAKASIPLVYLPLQTFALTWLLHLTMLAVSSVVLSVNGLEPGIPWRLLEMPRMTMLLLYHLVTVHGFWHAPYYGWLLLVSAWAKRAALPWAVVPYFVIGAVERTVFGTSRVTDFLVDRLSGGGHEAVTMPGTLPMHPMTHPTPDSFLMSPGLWVGLALTAVFLVASARLRHERGPAQ